MEYIKYYYIKTINYKKKENKLELYILKIFMTFFEFFRQIMTIEFIILEY